MKVVTSVKLLCASCYKLKVPKTRDLHYMYVLCNANPRHKQRTKWPRKFMCLAEHGSGEASSNGSIQGQGEFETCGHGGPHVYPVTASSLMPQLSLGAMQAPVTSALLASRTPTCCLGEQHWRAALQDH
uniref:Ribosomal protein n=1 Tax=Dunaliella tertiolecta TaxID=3047 RepID=A0A7S3RA35_DUNTE|mmetsp:Transcript_20145/g.56101  ORF Transcript_20145/g.56101 Transcript_20145/m.56101 type:complete len:129 (+) Transcript_20145:72-458(+)|eukprot:CAMPEP_0202343284 /NCGR_PEP_ID=MMETSP1126-20121109/3473_1 /ASSEMBLY_ACC=CAM_ASM_000457 /TAXON_ID=3047 /ORGANISM="Dunaliella tertiolecta, Strain CCMP1320" /LENGTH=128 /DNA_ID=CAMNT_0048934335 /DNA_START=65 /DNA_END=451 /DNA_ORIENTATION=+